MNVDPPLFNPPDVAVAVLTIFLTIMCITVAVIVTRRAWFGWPLPKRATIHAQPLTVDERNATVVVWGFALALLGASIAATASSRPVVLVGGGCFFLGSFAAVVGGFIVRSRLFPRALVPPPYRDINDRLTDVLRERRRDGVVTHETLHAVVTECDALEVFTYHVTVCRVETCRWESARYPEWLLGPGDAQANARMDASEHVAVEPVGPHRLDAAPGSHAHPLWRTVIAATSTSA